MIASRPSGVEGDGWLQCPVLPRVHRVDRQERVGQQPAHELEPVLGDLDAGCLHAVAQLFQGHGGPPVWENTATSIPTGGGLMTRVCRFLGSVVTLIDERVVQALDALGVAYE